MDSIQFKDVILLVTGAITLAASHFKNSSRISVLESRHEQYATHVEIASIRAEMAAHERQFERIEQILLRIESKMDGKADKN